MGVDIPLRSLAGKRALLHGHCHQKAFGVMPALESTLRLVPGLEVETIASSCCGMAGAFGYEAANYKTSMAMGELEPPASGAGGRPGRPDRRRRDELPAPDRRRSGPRCVAHSKGA